MNYTYVMILINILIWAPWLWRYRIKPHYERKNIWTQLTSSPDKERYKITHSFLTELYADVNAGKISKQDRRKLKIEDDAFIYGEIDFLSFIIILDQVKPKAGEIFVDLGSGTGKAVLAAALNFHFSQSIGVELLPGLCQVANSKIKQAATIIEPRYKKFSRKLTQGLSCIRIVNDDLQNVDFSHADIVFINATCFSYNLWDRIQQNLLTLKSGSRVIVTSKKIQADCFELVRATYELMSWGMNSVNLYLKK